MLLSPGISDYPRTLKVGMGRPADDFILQFWRQVDKIIAVASDSDDEIPVIVGCHLRFFQGFRIHDIKLDVVPVKLEIGSNQMGRFETPVSSR